MLILKIAAVVATLAAATWWMTRVLDNLHDGNAAVGVFALFALGVVAAIGGALVGTWLGWGWWSILSSAAAVTLCALGVIIYVMCTLEWH